jgi:hypothetical protein
MAKATVERGGMFRILVLLVAVAVSCGLAAGVTVAHAPVPTASADKGY